jgi:DNA-binding NtrC family response regulator
VEAGTFRQDLYYRISAFPIDLPPLRARAADIPMLIDSILQRGGKRQPRVTVAADAMARMQAHQWPGNIRELRNVLDRARLFADDGVIRASHLPAQLGLTPPAASPLNVHSSISMPSTPIDDATLQDMTRNFNGSRRELAIALGLSERTLYRRLKALGTFS